MLLRSLAQQKSRSRYFVMLRGSDAHKQVVAKLVFWPGCWSCSKIVMYHCFPTCHIAPGQHRQKLEARLGRERPCQEIVDANMSSQTSVYSLVCEAVESLLRLEFVDRYASL